MPSLNSGSSRLLQSGSRRRPCGRCKWHPVQGDHARPRVQSANGHKRRQPRGQRQTRPCLHGGLVLRVLSVHVRTLSNQVLNNLQVTVPCRKVKRSPLVIVLKATGDIRRSDTSSRAPTLARAVHPGTRAPTQGACLDVRADPVLNQQLQDLQIPVVRLLAQLPWTNGE